MGIIAPPPLTCHRYLLKAMGMLALLLKWKSLCRSEISASEVSFGLHKWVDEDYVHSELREWIELSQMTRFRRVICLRLDFQRHTPWTEPEERTRFVIVTPAWNITVTLAGINIQIRSLLALVARLWFCQSCGLERSDALHARVCALLNTHAHTYTQKKKEKQGYSWLPAGHHHVLKVNELESAPPPSYRLSNGHVVMLHAAYSVKHQSILYTYVYTHIPPCSQSKYSITKIINKVCTALERPSSISPVKIML
jgi:hypothetical protein